MIQNNNPGNLRYSIYNNWQGQIGKDYRGFVIFDSLYNGTRAMIKLVFNYINQGYNTIEKVVTRYAPPNENDTDHYIDVVSGWSGIGKNNLLTISNTNQILKLIDAMVRMETGSDLSDTTILAAYNGLINNEPAIDPVETDSQNFAFLPLVVIGGFLYSQFKS